MINAELECDIWQKGFSSLAAAAAGGGGGGAGQLNASASKSKATLECKQYSLLLTEPLFNFDATRALTEEVTATPESAAIHCHEAVGRVQHTCKDRLGWMMLQLAELVSNLYTAGISSHESAPLLLQIHAQLIRQARPTVIDCVNA